MAVNMVNTPADEAALIENAERAEKHLDAAVSKVTHHFIDSTLKPHPRQARDILNKLGAATTTVLNVHSQQNQIYRARRAEATRYRDGMRFMTHYEISAYEEDDFDQKRKKAARLDRKYMQAVKKLSEVRSVTIHAVKACPAPDKAKYRGQYKKVLIRIHEALQAIQTLQSIHIEQSQMDRALGHITEGLEGKATTWREYQRDQAYESQLKAHLHIWTSSFSGVVLILQHHKEMTRTYHATDMGFFAAFLIIGYTLWLIFKGPFHHATDGGKPIERSPIENLKRLRGLTYHEKTMAEPPQWTLVANDILNTGVLNLPLTFSFWQVLWHLIPSMSAEKGGIAAWVVTTLFFPLVARYCRRLYKFSQEDRQVPGTV